MDQRWRKGVHEQSDATIAEQSGVVVGDRDLHARETLAKPGGRIRRGVGTVMDAVRRVVENEKNKESLEEPDGRIRSDDGRAMDAVREVVENEGDRR